MRWSNSFHMRWCEPCSSVHKCLYPEGCTITYIKKWAAIWVKIKTACINAQFLMDWGKLELNLQLINYSYNLMKYVNCDLLGPSAVHIIFNPTVGCTIRRCDNGSRLMRSQRLPADGCCQSQFHQNVATLWKNILVFKSYMNKYWQGNFFYYINTPH